MRRRNAACRTSPDPLITPGSVLLVLREWPACFAGQIHYLIGADADATHSHLPPAALTQVSAQRSFASIALPAPSVPFPTQLPVTIAESPCTITFMSLISLVVHFAFFTRASTSALPRSEPSESSATKSSDSSGASASALPAFEACAHWFSILIS